jgi:hypothetical protein
MANDYRISNGVASLINGTGVITVAAGITAFSGAGTLFTTEMHVGDLLIINGNVIGSIASITDNDDGALTSALMRFRSIRLSELRQSAQAALIRSGRFCAGRARSRWRMDWNEQ